MIAIVRQFLLLLVLATSTVAFPQSVTHTWKATPGSSAWNTAANWVEGSVPTTTSVVKIPASATQPVLSGNTTISYLHLDFGAGINIGANTLTLSNTLVNYNSPIVSNGGTIQGSAIGVFVNSNVQGNITLIFDTGIMQGNNVFQNNLTLTVNPTLGTPFQVAAYNPDTYYGTVTITNNGSGGLNLAGYADSTDPPTTFEQAFTYINNANSLNYFAEGTTAGSLLFKGNVTLTDNATGSGSFIRIWKAELQQSATLYTKASEIQFGGTVLLKGTLHLNAEGGTYRFGTTNVVLSHPATIQVGGLGFSSGTVLLGGLQYQSTTPLTLLLGDGSTHSSVQTAIQTDTDALFTANTQLRADYIELNGGTYNGTVSVERTGPNLSMTATWNGGGVQRGGNVFANTLTVTNHSGTSWTWGTQEADGFNAEVKFIHGRGNNSQLYMAHGEKHRFKGNIRLESTSDALASSGIQLGFAGDSTELEAGKLLLTTGFLGGKIKFFRFNQRDSDTPQTVALPQAATLQLEQAVFEGELSATAGHLEISNSIFYRRSDFIKTATGTDCSNGFNLFHRRTKFTNQAPAGNNLRFSAPNYVIR
jgi:hypothetical protein